MASGYIGISRFVNGELDLDAYLRDESYREATADGSTPALCRDCRQRWVKAVQGVLEPRCPDCFDKHRAGLAVAKIKARVKRRKR